MHMPYPMPPSLTPVFVVDPRKANVSKSDGHCWEVAYASKAMAAKTKPHRPALTEKVDAPATAGREEPAAGAEPAEEAAGGL